jgi:hypothetical protein
MISSPCSVLRASFTYFDGNLIDAKEGARVQKAELRASRSSAHSDRSQIIQVSLEHFALQREPHALAFASEFDEAGVLQLLYMVGERGGRDRLALADVGAEDALATCADLLKDLMTARIGERLSDEADLALGEAGGFWQAIVPTNCSDHILGISILMRLGARRSVSLKPDENGESLPNLDKTCPYACHIVDGKRDGTS